MAQTYSEIFAAKVKTVTSPDGRITVALAGGTITDVDIIGGAYSRYRESDLEVQITSLIKLIIVARKRSRREALLESLGHDLIPRRLSSKDREYRGLLKDVVGEAHSSRVSIYAQPGEFWEVEIREDSLEESTGAEFIRECLSVAERAMGDLKRKVRWVNDEVYGHIGDLRINK